MFGIKTYLNRLRHTSFRDCIIARNAKMDSFPRLGRRCVLRDGSRVLGRVRCEEGVVFSENCIVRGHVHIGRRSHIGVGALIENYTGAETEIRIGRYCSFGPGVVIYGNTHRSDYPSTGFLIDADPQFEWALKRGPTIIGNDVWLGANSFIAPGIAIGDGAVVSAGAVVTKDVSPYEIVAGVPARRLRMRLPQDAVQRLLEIRWWDWPAERLREHREFFTRPLGGPPEIPR